MKQVTFILEIVLDDQDTVLVRNGQNGQVLAVASSVISAAETVSQLVEDYRSFDPQAAQK